jgi:uncharacterized membrane protein YqjE
LRSRLGRVVASALTSELSFEEVSTIERLARRVELALLDVRQVTEEEAMDTPNTLRPSSTRLPSTARAHREYTPPAQAPASEPSAMELLEAAVRDARELLQVDLALARRELSDELRAVSRAAVGFGLGLAFAVVMLALLGVSLVLALGGTAMTALAVAGGFLVLALVAAGVGFSLLPRKLLSRTRRQVSDDLHQLEEHLA